MCTESIQRWQVQVCSWQTLEFENGPIVAPPIGQLVGACSRGFYLIT